MASKKETREPMLLVQIIVGLFQAFALVAIIMFSRFHRKDRNASTIIYFLITCTLILLGVTLPPADAHGNGAPKSRCESMIPGHWVNAQTSLSPYQIFVDKTVIAPGDRVNITLKTIQGQPGFKGFFVMVKEAGEEDENGNEKPVAKNKNYGVFDLASSDTNNAQPVHCFEVQNSAMTHAVNYVKESVELFWIAPNLLTDDGTKKHTKHGRQYMEKELKVVATFVKDFWTYWTDIEPIGDVRLLLTDVSNFPKSTTPVTPAVPKSPSSLPADGRSDIRPATPTSVQLTVVPSGPDGANPVTMDGNGSSSSWTHFNRAWSFMKNLFGSASPTAR